MKTVYIDVLFCVNFIIDFALLSLTAVILKRHISGLRLTLCALLGAAYAVAVFLPKMSFLTSFGIKLAFTALLTFLAFGAHTLLGYLKTGGILFAVSFGFCGVVFGLCTLLQPSGVMISNDAVYIDIDPLFLFLLIGGSYCIIWLITRILPKRSEKYYRLSVELDGKIAVISALYDSGNKLTEPISNLPVIIAEYTAVSRLIPKAVRKAFLHPSVSSIEAAKWGHGYRLITAHGAFGGDALLPAFRADSVSIIDKKSERQLKPLFIAVTERPLSSDGRYNSLIGDAVLDFKGAGR